MDVAALDRLADRVASVARGEAQINDLLGLGPKELTGIVTLAISKMKVGQNEEATRIFRVLTVLEDDNPLFQMYLGLALERAGDLAGALGAFTANISLLSALEDVSSQLCQAYLLRSRLHAMRGELDRAAEDLNASRGHDRGTDPIVKQEIAQLEHIVGGAR